MTLSNLLNSTPEGAAALATARREGDVLEAVQTSIAAAAADEREAVVLENLIEAFTTLRRRCYDAARRNDGKLMGPDAWLRYAMSEGDLELSAGPTGIDCWGSTYSMQTMSNEHFSFFISYVELI